MRSTASPAVTFSAPAASASTAGTRGHPPPAGPRPPNPATTPHCLRRSTRLPRPSPLPALRRRGGAGSGRAWAELPDSPGSPRPPPGPAGSAPVFPTPGLAETARCRSCTRRPTGASPGPARRGGSRRSWLLWRCSAWAGTPCSAASGSAAHRGRPAGPRRRRAPPPLPPPPRRRTAPTGSDGRRTRRTPGPGAAGAGEPARHRCGQPGRQRQRGALRGVQHARRATRHRLADARATHQHARSSSASTDPTRITQVGLINGYAKVEPGYDGYAANRRITSVEWEFADGTVIAQDLGDAPTCRAPTSTVVSDSSRCGSWR